MNKEVVVLLRKMIREIVRKEVREILKEEVHNSVNEVLAEQFVRTLSKKNSIQEVYSDDSEPVVPRESIRKKFGNPISQMIFEDVDTSDDGDDDSDGDSTAGIDPTQFGLKMVK